MFTQEVVGFYSNGLLSQAVAFVCASLPKSPLPGPTLAISSSQRVKQRVLPPSVPDLDAAGSLNMSKTELFVEHVDLRFIIIIF